MTMAKERTISAITPNVPEAVAKPILDACCGSRMFWFDKNNENVDYMDIRELDTTLCDGRRLVVKPDILGDFTKMPFPDNTYKLVVFDPPHLNRGGDNSWIVQKYGRLPKDSWPQYIHDGVAECLRVLDEYGVLVFKWNEEQITIGEILRVLPVQPLFGHTTTHKGTTHWMCFMKFPK